MPHITDSEHGKEYLTDELRNHFEYIGQNGVEHDLFERNYMNPEKRFAALYWLRVRRREKDAQETRRFWAIVIIGALTLIATIAGILLAK